MKTLQTSQCSSGLLHDRPVRPRLYKGFSVSAHLRHAVKQERSSRHKQSCSIQRCAAAETQVVEDARQNGAKIQRLPRDPRDRTEDWSAALKMLQEGSVEDFEVSFVNRGGVRGILAGIEGFMPFSKMCTGLSGVNAAQQYKSLMSTLPGLNLRVKVVSVDVDSRTMILSERAAIMEDAMDKLKAGDIVDAVVRNLVPYGAFVSIKDPQTSELTGGHGLLHISDMSWDHVAVPEDVVQPGDEIQCKIKAVDKERQRIYFSLKLMEDDPLTQTLDKLFSVDLRDTDLELWISKEVLEDGFVLVTRAGRTVQELKVTTKLDVDVIKSAVQKVLQRLA
ncbi:MAG: ribosomal S1-like RNA-binding domain-containing [Trebouxia sp. A1-2]|nr:MAG: ribosomal S1-like RNA-binding domain-containing [Trebouxia sp. A1-2]